ncbi:integrin alpha [Streptomyces sp. WMMC500]|uniref:FG-GAP repeat protein n=1 Tax=Streptomyces sp. WMMC500 TaxID=3015154 RepID=UPI00248CF33A|nr:integrin alpha [Streptomyces sp. WMMC500]WBB59789.1 integrin alpha [Streptomyces sp. WMMC500]
MTAQPRHRALVALATSVVLAAGGVTVTVATPAAAAPSGLKGDFDGDGYRDLAIGDPAATVSGKSLAGAVVVLYGSAAGPDGSRRAVFHQATADVPGSPEDDDRFGHSLVFDDFDRDGYSDLLVGAPRENVSGDVDRGTLTMLWGGPRGLSGAAAVKVANPPDTGCALAEGLYAGDVDGDGAPDVSVAGRCRPFHLRGPFTRAGRPLSQQRDPLLGTTRGGVHGNVDADPEAERIVFAGLVSGDPGGRIYVDDWTGDGYARTRLTDAGGLTGGVGDVDGDGYGDLVTGYPEEPRNGESWPVGGAVDVWYGGPDGIDSAQRPQRIHQGTAGVPGSGESGDGFGGSVGVADTDADGHADVAVGVAGESFGGVAAAGTVTLLRGTPTGLTGAGARLLHQNTEGVPGAPETYDLFGAEVALGDRNRDGRPDLTVGVPWENGRGMVWHARGTAGGITTAGSFNVTAAGAGVDGDIAGFGEAIAR